MKRKHPSPLLTLLRPLAAALITVSLPAARGVEALLTDDSTIYSGSSAASQGVAATQIVNTTTTKCAVLRFEIASMLPAGLSADNIATATLRLYTADVPTGTGTISIYTVNASKFWNEGNAAGVWVAGTDYNSTPVLSGVGVASFSQKDYTALDMTSAVKGWIATPGSNNGLIIRPTGTIGLTFQTKEASTICHDAVLDITLKGDVGESVIAYNTSYGSGALTSNTAGAYNVATGYQALYGNTTGNNNVATGYQALRSNTSGHENIAIGSSALYLNTAGSFNIATGYDALLSNSTGNNNTATGYQALYSNTTGYSNVAIGNGSLFSLTTDFSNVAIGYQTLNALSTDGQSTAVGFQALYSSLIGHNTAMGAFALRSNSSGVGNIAIGENCLFANTTGNYNVACSGLSANTTGSNNTALGFGSLGGNTTGASNVAIGYYALSNGSSGTGNVAVGVAALANSIGNYNLAAGHNALQVSSTGNNNVALGLSPLSSNTTGSENIACGSQALILNTSGGSNIAIGLDALKANTTGGGNIGIGFRGGYNLTTGNSNIDIGNNGVAGESNTMRLGTQGVQTAAYAAGIFGATASGGVAVYIDANGHLGTLTSSRRFKREIADMDTASEAILSLRPVSFRYREEIDSQRSQQYGLIAEEVAEVAPELVAHDSEGEIYTVRYEAVNAMLLNEFQKEHKRVQTQAQTIARQEEQLQKLSVTVDELRRRMD